MIFNENTLRSELIRIWGEYGAHVEVYDDILRRLKNAEDVLRKDEQKLRQLFKNRSNCYADSEDVVQAMDEDCFIKTVNEALRLLVSGQLEAIRTDFCLWYYAQSQPLDAHKVVDWFASNLR